MDELGIPVAAQRDPQSWELMRAWVAENNLHMVLNIGALKSGRVETGPLQFGDDWPGLFIRGDDCLALAVSIRHVLEALKPEQARQTINHWTAEQFARDYSVPIRIRVERVRGH